MHGWVAQQQPTVTSASSQLADEAGQQLQPGAAGGPPSAAGQPAAWRAQGAGYAGRPPVTCTSV
jgi:hypothetical protein